MPHLIKIDLSDPQSIVDILKARNLDGKEVFIADTKEGVAITPVISADESRKRLNEALANIELDSHSPDLDSEWWIKTIKVARVNKEITVDFDNE